MNKTFYLTTPLYYVNDKPHIGHAYTTIAGDILARYHRLTGKKVFFLTGTDEHGEKIAQTAKMQGKKPEEWVDHMAERFKELWQKLDISYDDFIRTTEERHEKVVRAVFQELYRDGNIYKGSYEGWYCIPCETYLTETQLIAKENGIHACPDCHTPVKKLSEKSYFFKLSLWNDKLIGHYSEHQSFLQPKLRQSEIINFVKDGLRDISVSRAKVTWGIPIPEYVEGSDSPIRNDSAIPTIYVWFDALLNYISAAGYLQDDERFGSLWPADLHLVGKEIFRFHTVIWPAILFSLRLELPKKVFAHGWWTVEGEKMSKSKGNVIDPLTIISEFGTDSLRYFLMREVPFGVDGDFSRKSFLERYNSDLANGLGNLVSRTLTMIEKYSGGSVPGATNGNAKIPLRDAIEKLVKKIDGIIEDVELQTAVLGIWEIVSMANQYIEENAPWNLAKNKDKRLEEVLYNLVETLRILSVLLYPFLPETSKTIWQRIGQKEDLTRVSLESACWGGLSAGTKITKGPGLFPRK